MASWRCRRLIDRSDPSAYFFLDVGWLCAPVQYTVQCSQCVCLSRPPGACPALDSVGQVTPHAALLLQMHGVTVHRCSRDGGTDAGGCRGSQAPSSATDRFSRVVWVRYVRARPQDITVLRTPTIAYYCGWSRLTTRLLPSPVRSDPQLHVATAAPLKIDDAEPRISKRR